MRPTVQIQVKKKTTWWSFHISAVLYILVIPNHIFFFKKKYEMNVYKKNVTFMCVQVQLVRRMHSRATTNTASWSAGTAMVLTTAVMVLMKWTVPPVSPPHAQLTVLPATTTGVFPSNGCVTVTTTAAMALMNTTAVSLKAALPFAFQSDLMYAHGSHRV